MIHNIDSNKVISLHKSAEARLLIDVGMIHVCLANNDKVSLRDAN